MLFFKNSLSGKLIVYYAESSLLRSDKTQKSQRKIVDFLEGSERCPGTFKVRKPA